MSVAAIIIATALTSDGAPLALLPWDGERTLIESELDELATAGISDIEVVICAEHDGVIAAIARDNVEAVIDSGRDAGSALRAGAAAVPRGTSSAIVMQVSEPRPAWVYRALLEARGSGAEIARPTHEATPGRPLLAGAEALAWLRNITDRRGIDALLERWHDRLIDVEVANEIVLRRAVSAAEVAALRRSFAV